MKRALAPLGCALVYFLRGSLSLAVRLLQFSSLPSYKYNKTLLTLRPEGVTKSRNLIARTVARRAPGAKKKWRVYHSIVLYTKYPCALSFCMSAGGNQASKSLARSPALCHWRLDSLAPCCYYYHPPQRVKSERIYDSVALL